tara:strand:- start:5280 stop:6254 length:975 start_codon:yes stop_codon:yes gene_type:complete
MMLDLFKSDLEEGQLHSNFVWLMSEEDEAMRDVLRDWADGFIDRDGKFVEEFQRTFNSSWWELYLHAVLKSLGIQVDFSFNAPDFVAPDANLAVEAVISSHGQGMTPEWEKTIDDLTNRGEIGQRYLESLVRLSNSIDSKVRRYRDRYARLPHIKGMAYVIAIHNFATPDAHQLGDVAMQRLLYDVWDEGAFLKGGRVPLPTGLFLDDRMSEVSGVLFSSIATYGKVRALSNSKGEFIFQAIRIRNNAELIHIVERKPDYEESLRDGLRLFHNPNAAHPLDSRLFRKDDIREFKMVGGELWSTCHPDGDLCMRQVHAIKTQHSE